MVGRGYFYLLAMVGLDGVADTAHQVSAHQVSICTLSFFSSLRIGKSLNPKSSSIVMYYCSPYSKITVPDLCFLY